MKTITKVLTGVAALVIALSLSAPVDASCLTTAIITTIDPGGTSFVFTPTFAEHPNFTYGYYGPANFSFDPLNPAVPPLGPGANITFWRLGTGDPVGGSGDDNGVYDMIATGGFFFTGYGPGVGTYLTGGYLRGGQINGSWLPGGIDGCVGTASCMCMLITDQDGPRGFWATAGGMSDANVNTSMNRGGTDGNGNNLPIILVDIAAPSINGSRRLPGTFDVDLDISVGAPTAGNYAVDGCACGPTGFRVLQQIVMRGAMPPSDRSVGWAEPLTDLGAAQTDTALGGQVTVRSLCGSSNTDVYLTTQLVFDSGFQTSVVSGNSTRVECGPTLADPNDRPTNTRPGNDRPRPRKR